MSDTFIHFLTADDPPTSLTFPCSALVANSRVFADLLCLPASASAGGFTSDEPIELYEPADVIRAFFAFLSGESTEAAAVRALDEVGWEELARMGDKYDSHVVRLAVLARIWQLEADEGDALHSYTLASLVGDGQLLTRTARRAALVQDRDVARFGASDLHKGYLDEWEERRQLHLFACLRYTTALRAEPYKAWQEWWLWAMSGADVEICHRTGCLRTTWEQLVGLIRERTKEFTDTLCTLELASPLLVALGPKMKCDSHASYAVTVASDVRFKWEEMPRFQAGV
ncbi:hypothetical protein JCM11251_004819 [Rhodosporidiobolus azoricus]